MTLFPDLGGIQRSARISPCGRFRWTLRRQWEPGRTSVCWIMLNPSTADAEVDDPTIREVMRFSRQWGYPAATVVNLYPLRSSNPEDCRRWADWQANGPDWGVRDAIQWNGDVIAEETRRADLVIAAWGAAPWAQDWADYVVTDLVTSGAMPCPDVYCIGRNRDGSPKHPLARGRHRVPRDQEPEPYATEGGS